MNKADLIQLVTRIILPDIAHLIISYLPLEARLVRRFPILDERGQQYSTEPLKNPHERRRVRVCNVEVTKDNELIIVNGTTNQCQVYSLATGRPIRAWRAIKNRPVLGFSRFCDEEMGLQSPFPSSGIALLCNDRLAVCDSYNNQISIFNIKHGYLDSWKLSKRPSGIIAIPEMNQVAVSYRMDDCVEILSSQDGKFLAQCQGRISEPGMMAFFPRHNQLAVIERSSHRILLFSLQGSNRGKLVGKWSGSKNIGRPEALALLSKEEVGVLDLDSEKIKVFHTDGTYVQKLGPATIPGQLVFARDNCLVFLDNDACSVGIYKLYL